MIIKQAKEPGQPLAFEAKRLIIPLASVSFIEVFEGDACAVHTQDGNLFLLDSDAECRAFLDWYRRVVAVSR